MTDEKRRYYRVRIEIGPLGEVDRFGEALGNSLVGEGAMVLQEPASVNGSADIRGSYLLGTIGIGYHATPSGQSEQERRQYTVTLLLYSEQSLDGWGGRVERLCKPILNGSATAGTRVRTTTLEDVVAAI